MSEESGSQASGLEEITERELLDLALLDALIDLHTSLPARVESYDKDAQTCEITLMLNRMVPDGDGGWVSEELKPIPDVPVGHYAAGGFIIALPIKKGDTGQVVFTEANPGAWRQTGNQVDPGDVKRHGLEGGTFYPTLRPSANKLSSADDNNLVIGCDDREDGQIMITPSGDIKLSARANNNVVSIADLATFMAALEAAIAGVGTSDGGLAALNALKNVLNAAGWPGASSAPTDGPGAANVYVYRRAV